ncbi:hypothetical protein M9H77_08570 [Catharanthus roseus]|uniref:Uncharacterized protein n=1 Tax=Catharanthus roseus TaxID=4058 RepID=A0ACC0BY92_CATRO|nr:hypothetical protein M9H77_08570 [Catharanthus roseus]
MHGSPGAHRGDDDLGSVTDRTGRVESRTVTASFRSLRGRHITSGIPSTPTPFAIGIYYHTVHRVLLPNHHIYRLGLVLLSNHTAHTLQYHMIYMDLHIYQLSPHPHYMISIYMLLLFLVGGVPPDSSYNTYDYTAIDYGISSSKPFVGRDYWDIGIEGDRGVNPEPAMVGSLHIGGEDDRRVHDHSNDDDDDDGGDDAGDEEEPVPVALVTHAAPTSSFGGRPHSGKRKGLTDSFMLVMSKISGSRNKTLDKERDVLAPTRRKKAKSSDWELTGPADRGPSDLEFIPSYGGHVASCIWYGQDRGILKL